MINPQVGSAVFKFLLLEADNALIGWKCYAEGESRRWVGKTAWRRGLGLPWQRKELTPAKSAGAGTSGMGGSGVHSGNKRPRPGGR